MRRPFPFSFALAVALGFALIAGVADGDGDGGGDGDGDGGIVSEQVEVLVVNIEATVTDKKGERVDELERDDFRVLVDGEAVEITNFAALTHGEPSRDEAVGVEAIVADDPAGSPLQLVLYVDNSSVDPVRRNQVLGQVREFLRGAVSPGDRILLALASRTGFEPLHPYTDRWEVLEQGFDELSAMAAHDRRAREFRDILREIERFVVAGSGYQKVSIDSQVRALQARIGAYSAESHRDTLRAASNLHRLVVSQASWPGRKAVLYLGGSLALRPGSALHGALSQALGRFPTSTGEEPDTNTPTGSPDDGGSVFRDLAEAASMRGVTLHAIAAGDPTEISSHSLTRGAIEVGAGLAPGREEAFAPGVSFTQRIELQSSLELLAKTTGGVARFDGQGLGRLFDELAGGGRGAYSLGIQPPVADRAGHRIDVEVRGRGRTVRHRRVYRAPTADEEAARQTQSALLTVAGEQPFEVRLEVGEPRPAGDGGLFAVPVSVQVPVAALAVTAEAHAHIGQVSIFIATGDGVLATGSVTKAVFPVTLPNDRILEAMGQFADYRLELRMPGGPGKIACGVRDDLDPRLSIATVDLTLGSRVGSADSAARGETR